MKNVIKYEVYEDNGGGIYLFILDKNDSPIDVFSHFEYQGPGSLAEAIGDITNYKSWDNNYEEAKEKRYFNHELSEIYAEYSGNDYVNLIAWGGVAPNDMGAAGSIAFNVD